MNHKIQVTVDDHLNSIIKANAAEMGLSVSSFARLALIKGLPEKSLLDRSLNDVKLNRVQKLSLDDFDRQIDDL